MTPNYSSSINEVFSVTEVDTAIAVAGTLLGIVVVHFLDQKSESRRVAREVALRPLEDKQKALKDVYRAMVDLLTETNRIIQDPGIGRTPLASRIENLESSTTWGVLWFSDKHGSKAIDPLAKMVKIARKLTAGNNLTETEKDDVFNYFIAASKAIMLDLGIPIAESQLQSITRNMRGEQPK
jgi:hypothetical protein